MKLLLAANSAYPSIGGIENSIKYMGQALAASGHEVLIFCFQFPLKQDTLLVNINGMKIIRCPYTPPKWPHQRLAYQVELSQKSLRDIIADFKPDAIWTRSITIANGIIKSGYSGPLVHIFGTTVELDVLGQYIKSGGMPLIRKLMLLSLAPLHFLVAKKMETNVIKNSIPIVFSKMMLNQLTKKYSNILKNQVHLVKPGVDYDVFSKHNGMNLLDSQVKTDMGEKKNKVLYVGRLSAAKNLDFLIMSFINLPPEIQLVIVGSGPERTRLEKVVKNHNIEAKVKFVGQQDTRLPAYYLSAKVVVLPTIVESFGQVLIESMACGTPVIGFGGGAKKVLTAIDEIVEDNKTGIIVKNVTLEAFQRAILDIFELDNHKYFQMSHQAETTVRLNYSWKNMTDKLLKLCLQHTGQQ